MKLTVDQAADALYLNLDDAPAEDSREIAPGVILDYDASGKMVGMEMLHLSKRVTKGSLEKLQVEPAGLVGALVGGSFR